MLQIFVISSKKIQHKGYETLYKYTTRNPKAAVSQFVSSVPLQWQVISSDCQGCCHRRCLAASLMTKFGGKSTVG